MWDVKDAILTMRTRPQRVYGPVTCKAFCLKSMYFLHLQPQTWIIRLVAICIINHVLIVIIVLVVPDAVFVISLYQSFIHVFKNLSNILVIDLLLMLLMCGILLRFVCVDLLPLSERSFKTYLYTKA